MCLHLCVYMFYMYMYELKINNTVNNINVIYVGPTYLYICVRLFIIHY